LTTLDVSNNRYTAEQTAEFIHPFARMLKANPVISTLSIYLLNDQAAESLGDGILHNSSLLWVKFNSQQLGESGRSALAAALNSDQRPGRQEELQHLLEQARHTYAQAHQNLLRYREVVASCGVVLPERKVFGASDELAGLAAITSCTQEMVTECEHLHGIVKVQKERLRELLKQH